MQDTTPDTCLSVDRQKCSCGAAEPGTEIEAEGPSLRLPMRWDATDSCRVIGGFGVNLASTDGAMDLGPGGSTDSKRKASRPPRKDCMPRVTCIGLIRAVLPMAMQRPGVTCPSLPRCYTALSLLEHSPETW